MRNSVCKRIVIHISRYVLNPYIAFTRQGALLFVGDGHARQGDGECCGTALETSLAGTFKLSVIKPDAVSDCTARDSVFVRAPLTKPRAETPTEIITMAIDDQVCNHYYDTTSATLTTSTLND